MAATLTRCPNCGQILNPPAEDEVATGDYAAELDANSVWHDCPAAGAPIANPADRPARVSKVSDTEATLLRILRAEDHKRWTYRALGDLVGIDDQSAWDIVNRRAHKRAA